MKLSCQCVSDVNCLVPCPTNLDILILSGCTLNDSSIRVTIIFQVFYCVLSRRGNDNEDTSKSFIYALILSIPKVF